MRIHLQRRSSGCFTILAMLAIFSLSVGVWLFSCMHESRTFNRLTGASTTTWDAMWVELRVQQPALPTPGPER